MSALADRVLVIRILAILDNPFHEWPLAEQEAEALRLASRGLTIRQVADRLQVSRGTADNRIKDGLRQIREAGGPELVKDDLPGYVQDLIRKEVETWKNK